MRSKMMKRNWIRFSLLAFCASTSWASETPTRSLEDQLQEMELPGNRAPDSVSAEKLYAVQSRYVGLRGKHELTLGAGKNFTPDSFLTSNEVGLGYRYHLNDQWSVNLGGAFVFNSLTSSGTRLWQSEGRIPDVAYGKNRIDLSVGYNAFYGKFRVSMDEVFYFDQYFQAGVGTVELSTGRVPSAQIEAGFAFWASRNWGLRFGFRDSIYNEKRQLSSGLAHNVIGHVDLALLLGGGAR
jgi:outer membrane beta-barrel protein